MKWKWLLAAVLIVRLLSVWAVWHQGFRPSSFYDPLEYRTIALNVLDHGTFSMAPAADRNPNLYRGPGYPLFLALTFMVDRSGALAVALQQVMVVATAALLFGFLRNRGIGRRASLAAAGFLLLEPRFWLLSLTTMSETLCAFLLMAALYVLFGRKRETTVAELCGTGALLGFSILVRPTTLLLLPFIAFALFVRPGEILAIRWRAAALVVAVSLLAILPWLIRNERLVGSYTMGSSASFNLVLGFGSEQEIARLTSGDRKLIDYRGRASTVYYGFSRDGYAYDQETERAIVKRKGLPWLFFRQVACAPRIWIGHEYPVIAEFALGTDRFAPVARKIDDALWGLLAALFFVGAIGDLFLKDARERLLRWSLYVAIFATSLANACVGYSRMMVPLYPILLLGICAGAARLAALVRRKA